MADPRIDLISCEPTDSALRERANEIYAAIHFVPTAPTDHQLVAQQDTAIVGLGRLVAIDSEPTAVELGGIWVAPAQRGRGLARAIVARLLDTSRSMSTPEALELYCLPFAKLEAFYASFGLVLADPDRAPPPLVAKLALCARTHPEPVLLMRLKRPEARI